MFKPLAAVITATVLLTGCLSMNTLDLPDQPADQAALVRGGNAFAADLYKQLASKEGNVFVSPISVSSAFGLLYEGAKGETAAEIADVMGFEVTEGGLPRAMQGLTRALETDSETANLVIANAAWLDNGVDLDDDYYRRVTQGFDVIVQKLDFATGPETRARRIINGWVSDQTRGRIKQLIAPGFISADTKLVLTNAVWFKADWTTPFDPNFTRKGTFTTPAGDNIPAELMSKEMQVRYLETRAFQAVDLPYKGDGFSLAVILPKDASGIAKLDRNVSAGKLAGWLSKLDASEAIDVSVTLPKVKTEASYKLAEPLKALGVRAAFTDAADLSGIIGEGQLAVSGVVHKTFLEINEKGTEAAAATGIGIIATSMRTPPPKRFVADHPFLLVLRHTGTGAILFIGRVSEV